MKKLTLMIVSGLLMSNLAFNAFAEQSMSDDDINTKITTAIQNKQSLPNVIVTTKDGGVTLTGIVSSQQEFQDLENITRKAVEGLKDSNGNDVQVTNAVQITNSL